MNQKVCVFPIIADGSVLLHKDTDAQRPTYGQYISPHVKFPIEISVETAAYTALDRYHIIGDLLPATHLMKKDGFHYVAAENLTTVNDELKAFKYEDLTAENGVADWVPKVMRKMKLIR